jgi:hypothetical protein
MTKNYNSTYNDKYKLQNKTKILTYEKIRTHKRRERIIIGICMWCPNIANCGVLCSKCHKKNIKCQRRRLGLDPWMIGKRGRPPTYRMK